MLAIDELVTLAELRDASGIPQGKLNYSVLLKHIQPVRRVGRVRLFTREQGEQILETARSIGGGS